MLHPAEPHVLQSAELLLDSRTAVSILSPRLRCHHCRIIACMLLGVLLSRAFYTVSLLHFLTIACSVLAQHCFHTQREIEQAFAPAPRSHRFLLYRILFPVPRPDLFCP